MKKEISVTNLKNIKKKNIPYMITWILYYTWVIVFTTWWTASPITDSLLGENSRSLLHSSYLIVSAITICIFKKEWFKKTGIIGSIITIITIFLAMLIIEPIFNTTSIILLAIGLGIVNVSILIPLVYIMNNTEKFYSMIGAFVLISFFLFLQEIKVLTMANGSIFSLILLICSLIPIIFFNNKDLSNEIPNTLFIPKTKSVMYVTILINCLYAFFCKGIGKAFLDTAVIISEKDLYSINYIGGLFGCIIYYLIYKFFKESNHFTWNFTFTTFIISLFILILADTLIRFNLFALLIGIASTMGMINMYYILGVIGKKYWNHTYVRCSIILIGLLGGLSGILAGKYVSNLNITSINSTVLIITVITIIILLALSPLLSKTYFKEEWSTDSEKPEVVNDNTQQFKKYKLTPKEIELCKLLIEGYTLRQSSTMMNIKESSIMGYQSKIYKKLKINSRTKLLEIFK